MMDAGSVAFEQSLEYAMMDAGSVASEQSLESALAPTSVAAAAAAAATAAAAPTSFSLYSLPDVAIGHVSSFLQFKVVARLLKVSKSTQEAVYASGGRGIRLGRTRPVWASTSRGSDPLIKRLILARHRHVWQASARITAHTQTLHRAALQITANKTSIKNSC